MLFMVVLAMFVSGANVTDPGVVGLVTNTQLLKQIGAPAMGVCLLLGLAAFAIVLVPMMRGKAQADPDSAPA